LTTRYCIGIDPGTKTGFCVWSKEDKRIRHLRTVKIHEAMEAVKFWHTAWPGQVVVVVEDARQATYSRQQDAHKAQGAGSVKRDCSIWDDYLTFLKVDYRMVRPKKAATKFSDAAFKAATNWTERMPSSHAKDACMLVFGM
jgi:hypothetical protein